MNQAHVIKTRSKTVLILYESELWQLPIDILKRAKARGEHALYKYQLDDDDNKIDKYQDDDDNYLINK